MSSSHSLYSSSYCLMRNDVLLACMVNIKAPHSASWPHKCFQQGSTYESNALECNSIEHFSKPTIYGKEEPSRLGIDICL